MCSTTLVTTSDTSRQVSSTCSRSIPQDRNVASASLRASETLIGSAGNVQSQEARSTGDVRIATMAMSSSMSPGTASCAACAMSSTSPCATRRTDWCSISRASSSE